MSAAPIFRRRWRRSICPSSGSSGCGWPSSPPLPSRCRCGRSIPGCPTPTSRRRRRARGSRAYGGLVHRMPRYAFTFMFFTLASVGLPGLSGFVGEFLVLVGAFKANTWVATLAATGLILGAAYALWLYRKVIFGELTKDSLKG